MTKQLRRTNTNWITDLTFLTIGIGVLFLLMAGSRPLFTPDEGRYAEIGREMITRHDFLTPYLNGLKYFEKPPLFYWLESIAISLGGLNLWSLRSINVILGLSGCLLTYAVARKLYSRTTGLLAALILATSTLYFVMAHMVSLDLPVTVFFTTAMYLFLLGIQNNKVNSYYILGCASFAALAVLTKGLIGLLFPGLVIGLWIISSSKWRLISQLPIISAIILFLAIAAPWHILISLKHPEFFNFYFIQQHFYRYATTSIGHIQPVWFFIPNLIAGFFPWIAFLPQTFWYNWQVTSNKSINRFLMIWACSIFIFFSYSKSKLIPYILPIFPALAILTANYIQSCLNKMPGKGIRWGSIIVFLLSIIIAYTFINFALTATLLQPTSAKLWLCLSAYLLVIGMSAAGIYAYKSTQTSISITIISAALFLLTAYAAIPGIDTRTIRPLANIIKPVLKTEDTVVTYNQYYQDLPFYLQRHVNVLNWRNELTFGMNHQADHDWLIDDDEFWKMWNGQGRVFVLMSQKEFSTFKHLNQVHSFILWGETPTNIMISNR